MTEMKEIFDMYAEGDKLSAGDFALVVRAAGYNPIEAELAQGAGARSRQLSQNSRSRRSKDLRFSYNSSLLVPTGSSDTHAFTGPQKRNLCRD
jgi:hypothetical protein